MYQSNSQNGRVCVNRVREGDQYKKTKTKQVKKIRNRFHIYFKMQDELLKQGYNYEEYSKYLQEKINSGKYHYKSLSNNQCEEIKGRYKRLIQEEDNKYTEIGDTKEINRKRRKQFREKKRKLIYERKRELIEQLLKEMRKGNTCGVLKGNESLSTNPDNWKNTKKCLFTGGKYIDTHDKGWVKIYQKIVSGNMYHLFDLHSNEALNEYIYQQ